MARLNFDQLIGLFNYNTIGEEHHRFFEKCFCRNDTEDDKLAYATCW
jgi:hypothetical protein